eukprot:3099904-Lingulodinium_polyedra.AAC.1
MHRAPRQAKRSGRGDWGFFFPSSSGVAFAAAAVVPVAWDGVLGLVFRAPADEVSVVDLSC